MSAIEKGDRLAILGVGISAVGMRDAVARIVEWAGRRESRYVCACDVHSLMRARDDATHFRALAGADMVTPDGQPIVWTAHMRGARHIERVCGPDLVAAVAAAGVSRGVRHYFYGGAPGVAAAVAAEFERAAPGIEVVGAESPPFRPLSSDEEAALRDRVAASGANVMWIGLGCPKQERWMMEHAGSIPGVVMIGIGAAFDFHSKRVARAPVWMQRAGLEWMHRLASEPARLWRRYLVIAPRFATASIAETLLMKLSAPPAALEPARQVSGS